MTSQAKKMIDVISIQMVRDRTLAYGGNRLTTPEQAALAFTELLGNPDREFFVAMMLDGKNRIVSIHVVSEGSLSQSIVHPRETFKAAVMSNAASVILAHNHPSGDLTPSSEDIAITRRLKEGGELLGIRILDHIIVNTDTGDCNSFAETGLL